MESLPSEAVAFLGAVGAFLFILIVFFLYLNKLLCFKNCGGFPCCDETPKKKGQKSKELGAAYAYEDESSSDSDDEVLKRFTSSAAIKRSGSTYSQKASASQAQIFHSASKHSLDIPGMADKSQVKQSHADHVIIDEEKSIQISASAGASTYMSPSSSKVGKLIDTDSPVHSSTELPTRDGQTLQSSETYNVTPNEPRALEATASLPGSSTMASAHMQEGMQTFNNEAFEGGSMSASGHLTDEHLFNIQDLQNDVPLISKCGSLEVTFMYNPDRARMEITIHQAQGIPTKDRGGANNTQVRLLLLPTRKQRHKTKVKQGDNPVFEEMFTFKHIAKEEATGFGVRFRLYGVERLRHDRMIGECIIGFASLSLEATSTHWLILEPRSNLSQGDSKSDVTSLSRSDSASSTQSLQHGGMPELLLGLAYNGTTGRLSVEVIKGSNFRNMAMNRAPDTYVRLTLMAPNGKEVTHSKTSVRRGQPNPLFKETFMFQVALFQLADVTLMISVYNKKSMKKKEMIGWIALGLNSSGEEETSHWSDMRESKGENICRWHALLES